jgi:hypothetical protein
MTLGDGGEVLSDRIVAIGRHDGELFVKFFVERFSEVVALAGGSDWLVFFCLLKYLEKDSSKAYINKVRRMEIAGALGLKEKTIKNSLVKLVSCGLLKRIAGCVYEASAELVFNGNRLKK